MKNRAKIEMEDKKRIAISDFERLLKNGTVGFYNSCEITQVFLHDKPSKANKSFFALACFSEKSVSSIEERLLSTKLHPVNETTGMGIIQFTVPIDEAKSLFSSAQNSSFQIGNKESELSNHLVLLPKQFVPNLWGFTGPFLSKILKPNFYGDSYVIEFFDEEKSIVSNLDRVEVEKIFQSVKDCTDISIDLSSVYDRVGGLIFQFPITSLTCGCRLLENSNSIRLNFHRHPDFEIQTTLSIACKTSQDDVVTGFRTVVCNPENGSVDLEIGDSDNLELFISVANSDLLLYHSKMNFLREMRANMMFSTPHAKPRILKPSDSDKPVELNIASPAPMHIGRRRAKEYRDHIRRRIQENEIISNSGDYLVLQKADRAEALTFVRNKLRSASELKEIALWDPYLNAQDIVDTLYYETTGVPIRCITSLKGLKGLEKRKQDKQVNEHLTKVEKLLDRGINILPDIIRPNRIANGFKLISKSVLKEFLLPKARALTFNELKRAQRKELSTLSNNLNVAMEFRCQHGNYGDAFHDRFLVLVPNEEEALPIVYSLGSSVNSLGKLHHLIQKVTNPRVILNNFNSLWNELSPEHCRVFLLPDDVRSLE